MPPDKRNAKKLRTPWLSARRIVQGMSLFAFLVIFLAIRQWDLRQPTSALPFLLDPLAMTSIMIAARKFLPWALLSLVTIGLTLIFGRAWCGWICPLGTLFDIFPARRKQATGQPTSHLRKAKHILLILVITFSLLGSLTLLIFDPITLLFRSLATFIWPGINDLITGIEKALYPISLFRGAVIGFERSVRPLILPAGLEVFRASFLFAGILIGIFLLNLIHERFWCRYLCPLGSGLGLLSKFSLFKRKVDKTCTECGVCAPGCPTATIDPSNEYRSDPAECTLCMRCLYGCPQNATSFEIERRPAPMYRYDPDRRDVLRTMGLGILGVMLFKFINILPDRWRNGRLILPPGSTLDSLDTQCIRCGECLRVCPTSGLQPILAETGASGWLAPVLVPRLGHCEYSCNACGQICPTGAIQPLNLAEKRNAVIGKAAIDQNRCIAWGERQACIVCQEVCPLPEKAIILEEGSTLDGQPLHLPRVVYDRCIGCGTCENKCPVVGPAAIQVYDVREII